MRIHVPQRVSIRDFVVPPRGLLKTGREISRTNLREPGVPRSRLEISSRRLPEAGGIGFLLSKVQ